MWSFAIPCKIIFSTMVQNWNWKLFGEKKSWIIPTSIWIGVIFIYLGFSINSIHTEKKYYMLTFLFSLIMMCMGIHEIALSSWSISLLKKENIGYAASWKVLGNYVGSFISGWLFYSLNSVEFCNSYIYNSPKSNPIIDDQDFMFYVGIYSIMASAVWFVLYDEKEDQNPDIQVKRNFHQLISVASNMISNKNLLFLFTFVICSRMFLYTNGILGLPYIFSELKHDKTIYSVATLVSFPFDILTATLAGHYGKTNTLNKYYLWFWLNIMIDIIVIHLLYEHYSFVTGISSYLFNIIFLICYITFNSISIFRNCMIQTFFNSNCDRSMTSLQISIFSTVLNFSSHVSKLYGFTFADQYGIFLPNKIWIVIESTFLIYWYHKLSKIQKEGLYQKN